MNIEGIFKRLQQEKIGRDKVGTIYFSKEDYILCDYVRNFIPIIDLISYHSKRISKRHVFKNSLEQFKIFNDENYHRLLDIVTHIKIKKDYPLFNAGVVTSFRINSNSISKIILTPGNTRMLHLPRKIHDIDIVSLGHEYCHMLKETNILEHKLSLTLGEVIPIFYEFINYKNDFLREKHLQYRLFWLNKDTEFYVFFSEAFNGNLNGVDLSFLEYDKDDTQNIYEYAKSVYGNYLVSFYYALILYNMYKDCPLTILGLVNDVLAHKITTLDMLKKLNIYRDIKGEVFEKEIKNIKKVLTR